MSDLKTKRNNADVEAFLNAVENESRRKDAFRLLEIMREITGAEAEMWGGSIVGFGSYHYVYASGREGDWPLTGFSPRKQSLSVYLMAGFDIFEHLLNKLGKHKIGKGCLYINKMKDIDELVLKQLIAESNAVIRKRYG